MAANDPACVKTLIIKFLALILTKKPVMSEC